MTAKKTADVEPKIPRRRLSTAEEAGEAAPAPRISLEAEHAAQKKAAKARVEEEVTVVVPRPYTLTTGPGTAVSYEAGTQEMPKSHAEHWYSRAHGVEIYTKS